jgi:hypothetical protein
MDTPTRADERRAARSAEPLREPESDRRTDDDRLEREERRRGVYRLS